MDAAVEKLKRAAAPLLTNGYVMRDQQFAAEPGSATIVLEKNDVRVQLVNKRWEWFVSIGSLADPGESSTHIPS